MFNMKVGNENLIQTIQCFMHISGASYYKNQNRHWTLFEGGTT